MATISVGFNSSSSTESNEDKFEDWPFSDEYIKMGLEYTFLGMALLGIVGNVFLLLMARYMVISKKKAGYVLLYYMTISDIVSEACYIWARLVEKLSPINQHNQALLCGVYVFIRGGVQGTSSFMTMAMSFERLMAMFFPFRYKDMVKVPLMSKIGIACAVFNIFYSGISTYFVGNESGRCFSAQNYIDPTLYLVFAGTTAIMFILIPGVSTACVNIILTVKIKRRANSAEQNAAGSSTSRMLLAVTSIFVVSLCLHALIIIGRAMIRAMGHWTLAVQIVYTIFGASIDLPVLLSSSANFPVLFCFMQTFRSNLKLALAELKQS